MSNAGSCSSSASYVKALALLSGVTMIGCQGGGPSRCQLGREVTIPSSDATAPAMVVDFHLPDGQIVSVSSNAAPPSAPIRSPNGRVTILAKASDDQGVRDTQLWVGTRTCSLDPNTGTESCSGPTLQGSPTVSNRDPSGPGQIGCTERLVSHNLTVSRTPTRSVSFEIDGRGVNFGGREVRTGFVRLVPQ
jgi:hypothetical protein